MCPPSEADKMPLVDFFCETCAQPRLLGWWGQLKRALSRELTQLTERRHVTAFIAAAFLDPQSDADLPPPPPQKEAEPPPHRRPHPPLWGQH